MEWNVNNYDKHARYVSEYGKELLSFCRIQRSDNVLDIGCGDGVLTKIIADKGCTVLGIDSSTSMVEATRAKGVDAIVLDAQEMNFNHEFDVVFSNAALHWMKKADSVIKNVHNALKKNGHFCAEFGAMGNIKTVSSAIYEELEKFGLHGDTYNPWYFPNEQEYRQKLLNGGFKVIALEIFDRPTDLPTNLKGWLRTFIAPFLQDVDMKYHDEFICAVSKMLSNKLKKDDGTWYVDYVRCRFIAQKA